MSYIGIDQQMTTHQAYSTTSSIMLVHYFRLGLSIVFNLSPFPNEALRNALGEFGDPLVSICKLSVCMLTRKSSAHMHY